MTGTNIRLLQIGCCFETIIKYIPINIFSFVPAIDQSSDSSDGVTEQLLKETRMRLKILEEESKAIEENYKTLQHGISQIKL